MNTIRLRKDELRHLQVSQGFSEPLTKIQYLEKWFTEQIGKEYIPSTNGYGTKHFKDDIVDMLYNNPVFTANERLRNIILDYRKGINYAPTIRFN